MDDSIFDENFVSMNNNSCTADQMYSISKSGLYAREHRTCCHRCGNIRKNVVKCTECPHVFCGKCSDKMIEEHGMQAFMLGCPFCKNLCCCGTKKSINCKNMHHCYKKCLAAKAASPSSSKPCSPASRLMNTKLKEALQQPVAVSSCQPDGSTETSISNFEDICITFSDSEDDVTPHDAADNGCVRQASIPILCNRSPRTASLRTLIETLCPIKAGPSREGAVMPSQPDTCTRCNSETEAGETPSKRVRTKGVIASSSSASSSASALDGIDVTRKQFPVYPTQPPFTNATIPPILTPHSLTIESNPFFMQQPSSYKLPSISNLIRNSNNHSACFDPTLPEAVSDELCQLQSSQQWPVTACRFDCLIDGRCDPPPSSVMVSTPNIDHACRYLLQHSNAATDKRITEMNAQLLYPRTPMDARTRGAPALHSCTQSTHGTGYTRGTGHTSGESRSQCSSVEVKTPNARVYHHHHPLSASMHDANDSFYNWTGSTVDTQCSLGVDLLTPCALPQCTPITAVREDGTSEQQGPGFLSTEHEHSSSSSSSPSLLYSHLLIDSFCEASYASHPHPTDCPTYEDIFSIYHPADCILVRDPLHPPMQAATMMTGCEEGGTSCDQDVM